MRKIIISAAAAVMALSTTASALEDIKVNGQAKIWYETNNAGTNDMLNKNGASGEATFKLGVTGKQGNVGFGATVIQASTMGLEGTLVNGVRSGSQGLTGDGELYTSEMYITAPIASATLKIGKQELDTPLAFTERWNSTPNTFNAAVGIIPATDNLTVVAAYVGQGNNGEVVSRYGQATTGPATVLTTGGWAGTATFALAGLYKNDSFGVNVWAYELNSLANAIWVDAAFKAGPAALKLYAAQMMPKGVLDGADSTTAFALSAGMKVGSVNLFAAASMVSEDGALGVGNTATLNGANAGKKTKLPTMAVYLDGRSVAAPGATSVKVKAATKVAGAGLVLQGVMVNNDENGVNTDAAGAVGDSAMEIDLIASKKFGDINLKGIIMHRDFDAIDAQQHVRVIASVNF